MSGRQTPRGGNQREADVAEAFKRAVDDVLEQRPELVLFAGDVFHSDGRASSVSSDRQAPDVFQRLYVAAPAHHVFLAGKLDNPAADFVVAVANHLNHFVEREIESQQLVWIEGHLVLLHVSAHRRDFRHAGNAFQPVADVPVIEGAQLPEVVFPAAVHQGILESPADSGGVRPKRGRDAFREFPADFAHVFENAGSPPVNVRPLIENHRYVREPIVGRASDHAHVRGCQHSRHNRVGNLVFDQVGTAAGPFRVKDHLGVGQIGNRIEGDVEHGPDADDNRARDQKNYEQAVRGAVFDDAVDHDSFPR